MATITLKPKNVHAEMKAVFKARKADPMKALRERFKEEGEERDQPSMETDRRAETDR